MNTFNSSKPAPNHPVWILPVIIVSQFAGGSLWFSGNAILDELLHAWSCSDQLTGTVTSAVQFGFILGTLVFSIFGVADRYSPRKVFFTCTLLGGIANSLIVILPAQIFWLLLLRFTTGFFIAGIYPVGMKIASGWYDKDLGKALGWLVGALVLGTAFPHALQALGYQLQWRSVLLLTSLIAITGGLAMLFFVADGPFLSRNRSFNREAFLTLFQRKELRAAAFGYFGHMWELYTLWAFLPFVFSAYAAANMRTDINISLWAFIIIGSGSIGCVLGGVIANHYESSKIAFVQLAISGCCCLLSPVMFSLPPSLFFLFMLLWGITAAGDSPQYSTVIAKTAVPELVGSTLTLVNCIGFFLTILSIQLVEYLSPILTAKLLYLLLLPGPLFGLYSMRQLVHKK